MAIEEELKKYFEMSDTTGDLSEIHLPEDDTIPAQLRGLSVKDVVDKFGQLEKGFSEQGVELGNLRQLVNNGGTMVKTPVTSNTPEQPPTESETPVASTPNSLNEIAMQELLYSRVKRKLDEQNDEILSKYHQEVIDRLNKITDPDLRISDSALEVVMGNIRGAHIKEYQEKERERALAEFGIKRQGDTIHFERSAIGILSNQESESQVIDNLDDRRKNNLAGWFGGSLDQAKKNLLKGGG